MVRTAQERARLVNQTGMLSRPPLESVDCAKRLHNMLIQLPLSLFPLCGRMALSLFKLALQETPCYILKR